MILVALFIGVILVVAAIRNSQGALFSALATDIPEFVIWAAAIIAIGSIGFVPGLKPVSRGLLALILIVIILNNYKNILSGFTNAWKSPPAASGAETASGGSAGLVGQALGDTLSGITGGFDFPLSMGSQSSVGIAS